MNTYFKLKMSWWLKVTLLLSFYGFLKEIRPITPFLTPYLMEGKNFTEAQLYGQVYPVWTYSYLACLIPVFLLTDLLKHRPVVIFESLAYVTTWLLLIWGGTTVTAMQLMQICYGCGTAAEVAFNSYIYTVVKPKFYLRVTSWVKSSVLIGRCLAYGLAQVLITWLWANYDILNYISLAAMALVFITALLLPKPLKVEENLAETPLVDNNSEVGETRRYFTRLYQNFRLCYANGFVLKWSVWWSLSMCGFFQVGNYIQTLWAEISVDPKYNFNGVTEATNTLLGAAAAFLMQFLRFNWPLLGELSLGLIAALDCVLLILLSQTRSVLLGYLLYVIFCVFYQLMITIATYNIAKHCGSDSYGLVFGCNTFFALLLQTILTLAVADSNGFNLDIRTQFVVYGCYSGVIGSVFILMGLWTIGHFGLTKCPANCWLPSDKSDPITEDQVVAETFTLAS